MKHQSFIDMGDFTPSVPIPNQIRKLIFEKFNDTELKFNNDEIFEILKNNGDIDKSWTIDDMEKYFKEICDSGLGSALTDILIPILIEFLLSLEF